MTEPTQQTRENIDRQGEWMAGKLHEFADKALRQGITPFALAHALLATAINVAGQDLGQARTVQWLRDVANQIERDGVSIN